MRVIPAGAFPLLLSLGVLWAVPGTAQHPDPDAVANPETLVAAAAAWARTGSPAPYDVPLAWPSSPRTSAWVYTPLVRAALWLARQPADAPAAVPGDLLAPVVLVALRAEPECCPRHEPHAVGVRGFLLSAADVSAGRVENPSAQLPSTWSAIGAGPIADLDPSRAKDVGAVIAFPTSAFRVGYGFSALVTMRSTELNGGNYHVHHNGVVRAEWR
jgi:hypothetical protein